MRILEKTLTAVFYFFVFIAPCTAHIIALKLQSDNRHMIPFSDFEFSNVGYVSFVISSVTVTSTSSLPPDPSRIGFLFQSHKPDEEQPFKFQQNTTICDLDFKLNSSVLFTFQNRSYDTRTSFDKTYPVTDPGMKSFFFFNCNNESLVTMDGGMELYNIDEGTTKNYLSAGLTQLPFLYMILSFIYLSFLGFWILVCFKNRRCFHRTHLLMGGLLVLNIVYFICVAVDLHYVKFTGTAHELDVLFFVLQLIRGVFWVTLLVLISGGWYFWKPFLEGKEKLFLMIMILLYVWVNIDPILPWEAAMPYDKLDWSIVDIMGCFFILIPIARSIIYLEEISETDLNAERNLRKLWLFTTLIFVYVIYTWPVALVGVSSRWQYYVAKETSTLVFCMLMFYIFRPVDRMTLKMATPNEESCMLSTSISDSCLHSPV